MSVVSTYRAFTFGQNDSDKSNFAQQLSDFWKDDFAPLESAGRTVMNCLREDDSSPDADLYRRISSNNPGSHYYYSDRTRIRIEEIEGNHTWRNNENILSSTGRYSSSTQIRTNGNAGTIASPYGSTSVETVCAPPLLTLKYQKSEPLPQNLREKRERCKVSSFMGLLAPAGLAWMTVDSTVYLWSIRRSSSSSFCWFEVPSKECIVSVGLVRPKKGIFNKDTVEWCLVIATASEVLLCVLAKVKKNYTKNGSRSIVMENGNHLRLVPTEYYLPTENIRMNSIAGTESGRIFLGGEDGCLYEMIYESKRRQTERQSLNDLLDRFYDHDETVPNVITVTRDNFIADDGVKSLTKRAWDTFSSGINDASTLLLPNPDSSSNTPNPRSRPIKCQKINRTSTITSVLKNVLPEMVVNGVSFILGGRVSTGGGKIEKIVVDEDRECLYTLSFDGHICAFDLREYDNMHSSTDFENGLSNKSGRRPSLRLASIIDTTKVCRTYLEAVQRGQMAPYGTNIVFPGGSTAAQANVGDKEGARTILKKDKESMENNNQFGSILRPTSIHVIPPTESSRLTLLAVTTGGLRLYLSALAPQVISNGPGNIRNRMTTYSGSASSLAPFKVMTLCNIRSPPPISSEGLVPLSVDSQVEDAVPPSVYGVSGQLTASRTPLMSPLVDSCVYSHGLFVAAVRDRDKQSSTAAIGRNSNGSTSKSRVADMVVSLCPDLMKRRLDRLSPGINSSLPNESPTTELITPGGISETVTFPMSSAYGYQAPDSPALLPGGIVEDIAILPSEKSRTITNLTFHSRTPTDSELSIGLPSPYVASGQSLQPFFSNGRALALNNDLANGVLRTLGGLVSDLIFARQAGSDTKSRFDAAQKSNGRYREAQYRLSRRNASVGFSSTAEEKNALTVSDTGSIGILKSSRLRPSLLHPDPVPLHDLAILPYSRDREIVMLNSEGLHFFGYETLPTRLADSISSAGENVRRDSTINAIFSSYGFIEGCAMCLSLAVGVDIKLSELVREKAIEAAMARALVPKLSFIDGPGPRISSGVTHDADSLVPSFYEFEPSAISRALFAVFARLTRPFWNKPAVVVTEGRIVKTEWTRDVRSTSAKVELLLDQATTEAIYLTLQNLRSRMKGAFRMAIEVVPGGTFKSVDTMDVDSDESHDHQITRSLQHQSNLQRHLQAGDRAFQLTESETIVVARQLEEKTIHCLYRLLSRTVQVLDLIALLRNEQTADDVRDVNWGQLHGLTYRQLVQTTDGHERVERVLSKLVTGYASDRSDTQVDQVANTFAERCYLFFSPGSWLTFLGIRSGKKALEYAPNSSARNLHSRQSAQLFADAAVYWHSAPLVTGRTPNRNEKDSFREIALRAYEAESPLALAVGIMLKLEEVASIVHVCLTTASNFMSTGTRNGTPSNLRSTSKNYDFQWELNLYHAGRIIEPDDVKQSNRGTQSSALVPARTDVATNDTVLTCFALIFHCLSTLLDSRSGSADRMVSECADVKNAEFANMFFTFLLENNYEETLLRVKSEKLDSWLQKREDATMLLRYYAIQGRHIDAGKLASEEATSTKSRTPLERRIKLLSEAITSFDEALRASQFRGLDETAAKLSKSETEETLKIAAIQNSITLAVESDPKLKGKLGEGSIEALQYSLLDVNTLYHDYAGKLELYDECLKILGVCREKNPENIQSLWIYIFTDELLPCITRSEQIYWILLDFFGNQFNEDIELESETTSSSDKKLFDEAHWVSSLTRRIKVLGKDLYKPNAEFLVPMPFLLQKLNALREALPTVLSPSWAPKILIEMGIPYLKVLQEFENSILFDANFIAQMDSSRQQTNIYAYVELLQDWITEARFDNAGERKRQLFQATVALYAKIDMIRAQIATLDSSSRLMETVQRIEDDLRSFRG